MFISSIHTKKENDTTSLLILFITDKNVNNLNLRTKEINDATYITCSHQNVAPLAQSLSLIYVDELNPISNAVVIN